MKVEPPHMTSDKPIIGWICSYTPEEIILAAGCHPIRLSGSGEPVKQADAYLHANLCPYVRSIFDQIFEGAYKLDGIILVNSCDAMRRLYDVLRLYLKPRFSFIVDMPRLEEPSALSHYTAQLKGLAAALRKAFGTFPREEELWEAIRTMNRTRSLLQILYSHRKQSPPAINGRESLRLVTAATQAPKEDFNHWLEGYLIWIEDQAEKVDKQPRLMLSGSIIDQLEIMDLIEESGVVVVEDLCTGHRYLQGLVAEDGDPFERIAQRYLERAPCSRMIGVKRRLLYIEELIREYQVEGLIYHTLKFCDQFQYDYPLLRKALSEQVGVPLLYLEGDYTISSFGQLKTRIQAFAEMLREMA